MGGMKEALKLFMRAFSPPPVSRGGRLSLPSLVGAADAFLAASLALQDDSKPRVVLAVTDGLPEADRLLDDLRLVVQDTPVDVLEFPLVLENDTSALGVRLKTCERLKDPSSPLVVVAPFPALAAPIKSSHAPVVLPEARFSNLTNALRDMGYERQPQVEKEGDYAIRGGIVDVWSPGDENPVRAEFFGEEIERLQAMDATSQRSGKTLERACLLPAKEDETSTATTTLFDLLPSDALVLALEHNAYSLGETPFTTFFTGDPPPPKTPTCAFLTAPLPGLGELKGLDAHHPELFEAAQKSLAAYLAAAQQRGCAVFREDGLSLGFACGELVVVAKSDRTWTRRRPHTTRAVAAGPRLNDFDDLEIGECVVHLEHGVGRFMGSSEILVGGERREVFTIEYADGGKLHIPAEQAHLLSRYVGVRGQEPPLHRLDGKKWQTDRKNAQKAIQTLAASLLETQAKRESVPGFSYDPDCEGAESFAAAFPYVETPDQSAAIEDVLRDLKRPRPMDRLICGDAGYGKTEVAMRAAFVVAMHGRQVAVLAPTTVLAEQHLETFVARFDGTPLRIEAVSRFQSRLAREGTFKRLQSGACDIVIGTHALLSPRIAFRDLGLVIIDEEQRFGVRHKEFLKRLRATVDVLTMSATPIPRTLYLSMTGARDLSILRTPPHARVAVETRIERDADELVRDAIERELRRGGQAFFLHNRISSMPLVERRLKALFKDAPLKPRIVVAHGQMEPRLLARKVQSFARGDFDLLLSTTIIESGIDIPRANTILVDHADDFGMAELYQLRGRVGRSSQAGVAIFLIPPSGDIDSDARARLTALKRHAGLGSGFNLAVRDLELRGAGNLLGAQQSGHIAAIGFTLYCQLLKRTIARLKGETIRDVVDVQLNLDFINPRLPFSYVEDDRQRFSLVKRLAEAQDEAALDDLRDEMLDRFGPLPDEAVDYLHVSRLKLLCAARGLSHVDVAGPRAVLYKRGARDIFKVIDLKAATPRDKLAELETALRGEC